MVLRAGVWVHTLSQAAIVFALDAAAGSATAADEEELKWWGELKAAAESHLSKQRCQRSHDVVLHHVLAHLLTSACTQIPVGQRAVPDTHSSFRWRRFAVKDAGCVCVCVWATVSFCYPVHETWFKSSLRRTVRIVLWHKNHCWLLRRRRWRRLSLLCNCCQMLFVIVWGWLFRVSHNTKHHIMKNKQIIPSSSSSYSQNFYCSMAPPVELTWQIRLCSIPTMLCNTTLMWLVEKLKNYIWKGFNCLI